MYAERQLAYAPTPYSYTPTSTLSATINVDEELKLANNSAERDLYESLAEIYSIIVTLEALERAFLKDSVSETDYTDTCSRLLKQYKSNLTDDSVARAFGSLESFKLEWNLEVPRATDRLKIGLPATVEAPSRAPGAPSGGGAGAAATHIVSASENFITLFDAIKMNMLSKDTLHPILVETIQAVNKVTDRDFENKAKIVQWLITLNQMRAAQDLSDEQARELQFDMNLAYDGFKATLEASPVTINQNVQFFHQRRFSDHEEEILDVLDLPQIYTKPSSKQLLDTLSLLSLEPQSWDKTATQSKPKVRSNGVPQYLTRIVSSPLTWIQDDAEKEKIWDSASLRLSERSGRTGMGAISRSFRIPLSAETTNSSSTMKPVITTSDEQDTTIDVKIHEPALTEDNLGLKTWASSFVFARNWHNLRDRIPLVFGKDKNATILELGAGTGLVGIAAAAVLGAQVLLTDLPEIVPNLERNIASNEETIDSRNGSAQAAMLDWTTPEKIIYPEDTEGKRPLVAEAESSKYPLVVAADPIYSKEHPAWLVQTINCHLARGPDARVLIQIPIREAYAEERADLKDRMVKIGLEICHEQTEIGYDDWSDGQGEELSEVECWMGMWKWKDA
ncbi:VPS28-domain-containing protein [Aureobasidium pullulans]|uniref:VPS28-domain-containing protein n=1 Tax=Aureobasidium pullulans TaxID=5580 RepID=A0A4S9LMI4_AURPU|nr:VPS28-domain-containing protein [Aureobasidium pullulans]